MKNKNKILGLVITDGVGFRNFCLSDFLDEAIQEFHKVIIFSGLPKTVFDIQNFDQVEIIELPIFIEPFKTWFWRKFKEIAHLQEHKHNYGINDNLKSNNSLVKSNRGTATRLIYKITEIFHKEKNISYFEKQHLKSLRHLDITKFCTEILKETAPDLLFFTHQRPPYVVPLVVAAERLNIKIGSFIFSWDNLASKGRMAAKFQFYLVWSELMKKDLLHFYPSTKSEHVTVIGTPQFEPYVLKRFQSSKENFFQKFNLNPTEKTICFSCGDVSTSKNDPLYIECIASAIMEDEINEKVNFLVRTSPAEEASRFEYLRTKFPFIKWNFPEWNLARENHPELWSQRVPTSEDLMDLRMILEFSDIGVNMCSTMSLDFMNFNKPVINPVFGNTENGLYNDQRFLNYAHYSYIVESNSVAIAKNKTELIQEINEALLNPEKRKSERNKMFKIQVGKPLLRTGKRIAETLMDEAN